MRGGGKVMVRVKGIGALDTGTRSSPSSVALNALEGDLPTGWTVSCTKGSALSGGLHSVLARSSSRLGALETSPWLEAQY